LIWSKWRRDCRNGCAWCWSGAYRYFTQPKTLTVAAGSIDGDAVRLMSALAVRLANTNSSIRLTVLDTGTALEASRTFAAGDADLAVVRADVGNLSDARTVVLAAHGVVMIIVPPGSLAAQRLEHLINYRRNRIEAASPPIAAT
jgi:hypothetical protein